MTSLKGQNMKIFSVVMDDAKHIRQNLAAYLGEFYEDARDVFERFRSADRVPSEQAVTV